MHRRRALFGNVVEEAFMKMLQGIVVGCVIAKLVHLIDGITDAGLSGRKGEVVIAINRHTNVELAGRALTLALSSAKGRCTCRETEARRLTIDTYVNSSANCQGRSGQINN
jgi:hypothetical protein